jgi:hypothetical protein
MATATRVMTGALTDTSFKYAADMSESVTGTLVVAEAADESFSSPVFTGSATATSATSKNGGGNWQSLMLSATGLDPDTEYRAGISVSGDIEDSSVALLKTAPEEGEAAPFRIIFGSCDDYPNSPSWSKIAGFNPLMVFHLGDAGYTNYTGTDLPTRRDHTRMQWLRTNCKNAVRNVPINLLWGDHDFHADDTDWDAELTPTYSQAGATTLAVYKEVLPHYSLWNSNAIGHSFRIAKVKFIAPDWFRQRRFADEAYLGSNQAHVFFNQLQAVFDEVDDSVANGDRMIVLLVSPSWGGPESGYDTYAARGAAEQQALCDYIRAALLGTGIGLLLLTGDTHTYAADDGSYSDFSQAGGMKIAQFVSSQFGNSWNGASGSGSYLWKGDATEAGDLIHCGLGVVDFSADNRNATFNWHGYDTDGDLVVSRTPRDTNELELWKNRLVCGWSA